MAKSDCANYIDGGCIFSGKCSYDTKQGGNMSCAYFEQSVLPTDKGLESAYNKAHGIGYTDDVKAKAVNFSYKPCSRCSVTFKPTSRGARYCGDFCKEQARRDSHRKYDAKRR